MRNHNAQSLINLLAVFLVASVIGTILVNISSYTFSTSKGEEELVTAEQLGENAQQSTSGVAVECTTLPSVAFDAFLWERPVGKKSTTSNPAHVKQLLRSGQKRVKKCNRSKAIGKVAIFIGVRNATVLEGKYAVALHTMRCYAERAGYELLLVGISHDELVVAECHRHSDLAVMWRRHCALAEYMKHRPDVDWWLALDADTMVVNPDHCIEEYIDTGTDLIFYERFFSYEIMTGGFLVRNSFFAQDFVKRLADYEFRMPASWNGADNGCVHMLVLETLVPRAADFIHRCQWLWEQATDMETYMRFVQCARYALGARRRWPPKFKLLRRAHAWAFDMYFTDFRFCERMFMSHGVKEANLTDNGDRLPFERLPTAGECALGSSAPWPHRRSSKSLSGCGELADVIATVEHGNARGYPAVATLNPIFMTNDVGSCWPDCPEE